nr:LTA synthase family protein [Paenibacillus bovis]
MNITNDGSEDMGIFALKKNKQDNNMFIYTTATILLWLKLCIIYTFVFKVSVQSFGQGIVLLVTTFGSIACILGIGFLFKKSPARTRAIFIIHFILTGILYGNILYYRFYIDYVTVPVLFQFQNVGGLSQSTLELIKYYDIFMFVDTIFLLLIIIKKLSPDVSFDFLKKYKGRIAFGLAVIPLLLSIIVNTGFWNKAYDKELIVKSLGLYYYHAFDIYQNSMASVSGVLADGKELDEIEQYVHEKRGNSNLSDLHGVAEGKNVILIFLESTQAFVMDRSFDGHEVTPFLNKLKEDSLYFPNFYHQTAQGKTSDAEFIIDNSLYPLTGGSVFVRKPDNDFIATPHLLDDYHYFSASFHGNYPQFWNRTNMYDSLGYDYFFSKEDYNVTEENSINYGLKDIPFFEQSLPHLQSLPEPFYAKMLTLTNHFPFLLEPEDQFIPELKTEEGVVNRYFTTVRYEDEAIKRFFDKIKDSELYNNSIFVLVGDHYGISNNYDTALSEALNREFTVIDQIELQKVPLIIHVPGEEGKVIESVGGQVDLRATILDLLGIEDNTLSFGISLLSDYDDRLVIFRDGTFTTNKYIYIEDACYSKETAKKVKRNYCSPYFNQVQTELTYSDQIIYGDLYRFIED